MNTNNITPEELGSLKEAFDLYDFNKTGAIDLKAFSEILESLGRDQLNIKWIVKQVDQNGDGLIDFNEFVSAMVLIQPNEELNECFARFDMNGDGLISREELKEVMYELGQYLSDREIDEMMKEADTNSDGFIDFNEFRALIPSL